MNESAPLIRFESDELERRGQPAPELAQPCQQFARPRRLGDGERPLGSILDLYLADCCLRTPVLLEPARENHISTTFEPRLNLLDGTPLRVQRWPRPLEVLARAGAGDGAGDGDSGGNGDSAAWRLSREQVSGYARSDQDRCEGHRDHGGDGGCACSAGSSGCELEALELRQHEAVRGARPRHAIAESAMTAVA